MAGETDRSASDIGLLSAEAAAAPKPSAVSGKPRVVAEVGITTINVSFVLLSLVPWELKKGKDWYTAAQSVVLASTIGFLALLFVGNVYTKILRFQTVNGAFWVQVVLTLTDCVRGMALPDPGWETTDRLQAATLDLVRLALFCSDTLKGQSRWFRLFTAATFILATLNLLYQSYFVSPATVVYTVTATNTTFTTSGVQASVGTAQFTLAVNMLVAMRKDKDYKYCTLCTSF
jgi:hypothetical protein